MPIYEFRCANDHTTEGFYQKPADKAAEWPPSERICETCGVAAKLVPSLTTNGEIRFPRRWHYGVGGFVESTSDVNRIAKEKGLFFVGRDHGA